MGTQVVTTPLSRKNVCAYLYRSCLNSSGIENSENAEKTSFIKASYQLIGGDCAS